MRLETVLETIKYKGKSNLDQEISLVTSDSRKVGRNAVFVAIKGLKFDGHDHIKQALSAGACAVVCEQDMGLPNQILVKNSRQAYARMSANIHENPSQHLKLIAVTGTNGKTTITHVIKDILEYNGATVGLIGTIENEVNDLKLPAKHTTPDPAELHVLFKRMLKAGCQYVIMETSSHALDQYRLEGCHFHTAVFTNLTQDHLDYHGDMENYYKAKKKLFNQSSKAVINYDDVYGRRLIDELQEEGFVDLVSFSTEKDAANYTARNIEKRADGVGFALVGERMIERIKFSMPGNFSVSNAMAAIAACLSLGFPSSQVAKGIAHCRGVRGRAEVLSTALGFTVLCDYAHSPDGLEKILTTIRDFAPARVVTVFGCAGNRDAAKRPIMGEIVGNRSDFVVLTSDNPRDEDPKHILDQTEVGLKKAGTPYVVFVDRYEAIRWALENAEKDDIVLLAGKGHEDYQVLAQGTIAFDEHEIVKELVANILSAR